MRIRVELVGQFRDIVGSNEIFVELGKEKTIYDLILMMAEKYGREFEKRVFIEGTKNLSEDVTIVLNGRVISVDKASSTILNETDTVVLMPEAII
ncbi:MAG: MoaD family protein [Thermoproteota archaeon]|nr:MoaD family protein [Candidatus Brockarchaeota archaeon]MBO3840533.1 MoaD family protein [Candidatus Brockarchaeota archaeon]